MGLSGLVGAGATDALDEIIQSQLEKKKFAEMLRAQQVQEQQRAQQMAQQQSQFDQELQIGQQRANTEEQRYAEEQAIRMAQSSQPPLDPLAEYEGKKKIDLKYASPVASPVDPLVEYEGKKKIDLKYREPKAAGPDRAEWLIRGGKKVKGIYQDGDEPYDAVADRQTKDGSVVEANDGKAYEIATEAKRLAAELLREPGLDAAFGPIQSKIPTLRTDTSNATAKVNRLKALLTADNIGLLKGVLSDSDMILLGRIGTSLDETMGEGAARNEIRRIIDMPIQMKTGRPRVEVSGGGRVTRGKDGKLTLVPQ